MTTKINFAALSVLMAMAVMATGCKDEEEDTPDVNETSYAIKAKDVAGINGTATFIETSDTETTIILDMNISDSGTHPAHIHNNSAIEGGGIAVHLNSVDSTGKSTTVITQYTYSQLIEFDGYINVHLSETNMSVIMAQGDIGGNALTSDSKSYPLAAVNSSGVSGTALFEKRKNGNTLLTVSLTGTAAGGDHPAHIHMGTDTTTGGAVVVTLHNIDGASGKSSTTIRFHDGGTPVITYDDLLVFDGYIDVHESASNLTAILCRRNIGN